MEIVIIWFPSKKEEEERKRKRKHYSFVLLKRSAQRETI
jgi:hypothetical protein